MLEPHAKRPKYTWGLLWDNEDDTMSTTAQWSVTAAPVPMVPQDELGNVPAVNTIAQHPHLFQITTPIRVDHFEELLSRHPNQPAIASVCHSLWHRFWPHVHMCHEEYPVMSALSLYAPKPVISRLLRASQRNDLSG